MYGIILTLAAAFCRLAVVLCAAQLTCIIKVMRDGAGKRADL